MACIIVFTQSIRKNWPTRTAHFTIWWFKQARKKQQQKNTHTQKTKKKNNIKCVQRELLSSSPEPRSGSACRRTTIDYVTSDVCDQKYTGPTHAWVVRCLSWKTISMYYFCMYYYYGGRDENSNKTANNAKYSNCKGLNHETYDVNLQHLRSQPFWTFSASNFISIYSPCIYTS